MQKFKNTLWSGKCLSGEMSSRGSVRLGNCPFGEMSVGEVSVGDFSSGKCPVGKLSYNLYNQNPAIFWALAYLKPEACSKPYKTLTSQVHDPAIVWIVYSGIIQTYSGIFRTLTVEYAETWHIRNSGIFRILFYLHPDAYSEPYQIYKNRQTFITLEIQKPGHNGNPGILRTLTYLQNRPTLNNPGNSEPWHIWNIQNPDIFGNRHIFRTLLKI